MKKYLFILIIIAFFVPFFAFAGNLSGPLVPCGRSGQSACTLCDIFVLLQNIIDFITVGIFVFAPIFIAAGAVVILTSADTPDRVSHGKAMIKNAVIGLIIALLAWVVINELLIALAGSTTDSNGVKTGKIFDMPWNKIKCEGGGVAEPEKPVPVETGQYCVCEVPIYNLSPKDFPEAASIIGKDAQATTLASKDECTQKCVAANSSSYCPSSLTPDKANLYCASQSALENKRACKLSVGSSDCQISGQGFAKINPAQNTCVDNSNCIDLVTPDSGIYNPSFAKKCWLDGQLLCRCESKGTGDKPCQLYRYQEEKSSMEGNLFNCSVCRLDCKYDKCSDKPPSGQWCKRSAPAGSDKWILNPPPGGAQPGQKGDASPALASFLNCMYGKIPSLRINSISENTLCDNPDCDTTTTKCGSHSINACHYGGSKCTGLSYSVDFDVNIGCNDIGAAAKQCDSNPWINWENNHTHITISAGMTGCGCAEQNWNAVPCP